MGKSNAEPIYQPLDFVVARAPLLPVEAYLALTGHGDPFALLSDPRVRRAIAAGSVSLLHALDRHEQSASTPKETERLKSTLLRYLIRMSTRPTPYGLFAGSASVPTADRTDLSIVWTFGCSHTRPDMEWLMRLVATAESDHAIRRRLKLIANPLVRHEGERITLARRMPGSAKDENQPVSIRRTSVATHALHLAKRGIEYDAIVDQLMLATPRATIDKVERLLTELWEQTFLLTDLRPPLTTESPARYVLNRLAGIVAAAAIRTKLEMFLDQAARWDEASHNASVPELRRLLASTEDAQDLAPGHAVFQTDMALAVTGKLGSAVADEAARAAQLLLRMSPTPRGLSSIAAYRDAFVARYGTEREVDLMELLDPQRGLGSPSARGHAFVGADPKCAEQRSRTLLSLATEALHKRQLAVVLDEATVAKLATSEPTPENAPVSLDVCLFVAARSAAAIDKGEFSIVLGPNLGAWAAGRNFGRFAHLFPPGEGRELLANAARLEQTRHFPDHVWAEVVYLPANVRSANVAIRPAVRSHEVVIGVSPGVGAPETIPLDELAVGVANNRFYIRWTTLDKRVRFVSGHMLNDFGAPPVAQFLLQAAYDGLVPFTSFDWGPAEGFPFLPRVQVGRIVLRTAEWKIPKDVVAARDHKVGLRNRAGFMVWRKDWDVPRYVSLSFGDNRLILDLDREDHSAEILAEVGKLAEDRTLLLQEVLPAFEAAWLTSGEGHYYSEFVVPLVLRPFRVRELHDEDSAHKRRAPHARAIAPAAVQPDEPNEPPPGAAVASIPAVPTARAGPAESQPARVNPPGTTALRLYPPGSEWLFVKLYCPSQREDEVIAESLLPFADNALAAGLADSWFYIRYADPESHIRLRFHGVPDRLSRHLFGHVCQWATAIIDNGACTRIAFDTYDRELERFGGAAGMEIAESLFHADSRLAAELVAVSRSKAWADHDERVALFALTLDDLLEALGLDESSRLDWYRGQAGATRGDFGPEYRKLKNTLRAAVAGRQRWLADKPSGLATDAALARRRAGVSNISFRLRQLANARALSQSTEKLCASYVHLHLNRVGGASDERMLLNLLLRTRESLAKAPL